MAVIRGTSIQLPPYRYSKEDICRVSDVWLKDSLHERELFQRFVSNSRITHRHFAVPLETILSLGGPEERARHFEAEGRPLLGQAISNLLTDTSTLPHTVDHLVFTSCSAPTIPAIDVGTIADVGLPNTIFRTPIYQHGCAGGIIGLSLASRLLKDNQRAVVSAAELCSLVYQSGDLSGGNLVGSAIFGDGAAAVLMDSCGEGLQIVDTCSFLVPDSAHLMGYESKNDGPHLRLDRALPQVLAQQAPSLIEKFLAQQMLQPKDIGWWLFHPGGVKVLTALESALQVARSRSRWAWEVLEGYGNMSSASILFVLDAFLSSNVTNPGDKVCMVGVGPGLAIEMILLEDNRTR